MAIDSSFASEMETIFQRVPARWDYRELCTSSDDPSLPTVRRFAGLSTPQVKRSALQARRESPTVKPFVSSGVGFYHPTKPTPLRPPQRNVWGRPPLSRPSGNRLLRPPLQRLGSILVSGSCASRQPGSRRESITPHRLMPRPRARIIRPNHSPEAAGCAH